MVVDDNADSAATLGALLSQLGCEVTTCADGASALEAMRSFRPTAMIIDISMPGMDGNELARRIRLGGHGAPVDLIALTGLEQHRDRARALEAGFDYYLVKPARLATIQAVLAASARRSSGAK